jgi:hypothetical protein
MITALHSDATIMQQTCYRETIFLLFLDHLARRLFLLACRLSLRALILNLLLSLSSTSSSTDPWDIRHLLLELLSKSFFFLSRETFCLLLLHRLCRFLNSRQPGAVDALVGSSATTPDGDLEKWLRVIEVGGGGLGDW